MFQTLDQNTLIMLGVGLAVLVLGGVFGTMFLVNKLRFEYQMNKRVEKMAPRKGEISTLLPDSIIQRPKVQRLDITLTKVIPTMAGMRRRFRQAGISSVSLGVYVGFLIVLTAAASFLFPPGGPLRDYRALAPIVYLISLHLFVSNMVLGIVIERRKSKIIAQMPQALDFIIRAVKVGQPIDTAIKEAAKDIDPPMKDELDAIVNMLAIGTPLDRALRSVAGDLEIREFDFFAIATIVQIESGGNLSEALRGLSETIRSRHNMRLKVQALASEGKASAYVLSALPVMLLMYFDAANPEYTEPLWNDERGNMVLYMAFGFILVGALVMRRIIKIKI